MFLFSSIKCFWFEEGQGFQQKWENKWVSQFARNLIMTSSFQLDSFSYTIEQIKLTAYARDNRLHNVTIYKNELKLRQSRRDKIDKVTHCYICFYFFISILAVNDILCKKSYVIIFLRLYMIVIVFIFLHGLPSSTMYAAHQCNPIFI